MKHVCMRERSFIQKQSSHAQLGPKEEAWVPGMRGGAAARRVRTPDSTKPSFGRAVFGWRHTSLRVYCVGC